MIFFVRDDCGPVAMINKTSICLKNRKKFQPLGSAHQRVDDAQVGDRELQVTAERNKSTRTTAMTVQLDIGSLRAACITWSTEA